MDNISNPVEETTSAPLASESGGTGVGYDELEYRASERNRKILLDAFKAYDKQFIKQKKELENLKALSKNLDSKINDIVQKVDTQELKIEESKTKYIEILGIFVALFTFVSVDISVLKQPIDFTKSFAIILVTAGILITFVLLIDLVMRYWKYETEVKAFKKNQVFKFWIAHFGLLALIALFLIGFGIKIIYDEDPYLSYSNSNQQTLIPIK